MLVKLVGKDGKETTWPATHVQKQPHPDGTTTVEVCGNPERRAGFILTLPDDGEVVYIVDQGKTCDTIRPRPAAREATPA